MLSLLTCRRTILTVMDGEHVSMLAILPLGGSIGVVGGNTLKRNLVDSRGNYSLLMHSFVIFICDSSGLTTLVTKPQISIDIHVKYYKMRYAHHILVVVTINCFSAGLLPQQTLCIKINE